MDDLSPEIVREFLTYDPHTGKLYWKERDRKWFKSDRIWKMWNTRYGGKEAFHTDFYGYLQGKIFTKTLLAHRAAWCLSYGDWPKNQIDHIDGNRSNNTLGNLRVVTNAENSKNQKRPQNNSSGFVGVCWTQSRNKWVAQIKIDGQCKFLGRFPKIEDAVAARKAAEEKYGFHANHGMR